MVSAEVSAHPPHSAQLRRRRVLNAAGEPEPHPATGHRVPRRTGPHAPLGRSRHRNRAHHRRRPDHCSRGAARRRRQGHPAPFRADPRDPCGTVTDRAPSVSVFSWPGRSRLEPPLRRAHNDDETVLRAGMPESSCCPRCLPPGMKPQHVRHQRDPAARDRRAQSHPRTLHGPRGSAEGSRLP